jgi:hydrogenase-4 membrane subunit HyfE
MTGCLTQPDMLPPLVPLLDFLLGMTALRVTVTTSVARVIRTYQLQCFLLMGTGGITAWGKLHENAGIVWVPLVLIAALPVFLGVFVGWSLQSATRLPDSADVDQVWRDASEDSVSHRTKDVGAFVLIIVLAALVAWQFHHRSISPQSCPLSDDETIGLIVSLTLHLLGLYMIAYKQDLISQTVGLLVMDHGLYLAVIKIVELPPPGLFFVIGICFYTLITLFILFFLVPQVRRRVSEGIALDRIAENSELTG